jgi:hypothetical protein
MTIQLIRVSAQRIRFAARFAVLLLVLSVLSDLIGPIAVCFDPARPFVPESVPFCSLFLIGMLIEGLDKGGLAGLLWHYLPTIVASLSIAIAWTLKRPPAEADMNMAAPPLLRRVALRFAVLLLVLSTLYDLSTPVSFCFDPSPPLLPSTLPICFRSHFETQILVVSMGGLPGLAWHYLPVLVITVLVTIIWTWKDRRGRRA